MPLCTRLGVQCRALMHACTCMSASACRVEGHTMLPCSILVPSARCSVARGTSTKLSFRSVLSPILLAHQPPSPLSCFAGHTVRQVRAVAARCTTVIAGGALRRRGRRAVLATGPNLPAYLSTLQRSPTPPLMLSWPLDPSVVRIGSAHYDMLAEVFVVAVCTAAPTKGPAHSAKVV